MFQHIPTIKVDDAVSKAVLIPLNMKTIYDSKKDITMFTLNSLSASSNFILIRREVCEKVNPAGPVSADLESLRHDRLVGLEAKASASRAEDPGFESHLRRDFFGVESYQWLKHWHSSGYPARRPAL